MSDRPDEFSGDAQDPSRSPEPPAPDHLATVDPGDEQTTTVIAVDTGTSPPHSTDAAATDGTGPDGSPPTIPRDPWPRLVLVVVALAVVAIGSSLLAVVNATRLSALDEATHIDYAYRMGHGELPYAGQPLSQYTLDSWACRGQANIDNLPTCDSGKPYRAFPGGGLQYNAYHPPLYYAITGVAARVITAITGQDFVTSARAMGALWLLAGMLALYLVLRYWRVGWGWSLAGALLLAVQPVVLHASSIVSNDAPVGLAGAAALYVLGRHVIYRRTGWIVPVVLTVLVALTKVISAISLGAVGVMLLLIGIDRWRKRDRAAGLPLIRNAVLMAVALVVVNFGWRVIQNGRKVPGYRNPITGVNTNQVHGLPFDEWLPSLVRGSRLGTNFYVDPLIRNVYLTSWVLLMGVLFSAAALVGLAMFRRTTPEKLAAGTLLIGVVLYPLAVQVQTYMHGNYFPTVTNRYGIALIPVALGVLAMIAAHHRLRISTWLITVGGLAAVGSALVGVG